MSKVYHMEGQRYGKLVVIGASGRNSHGEKVWECLCDCGSKAIVSGYSLRVGKTRSCGCYVNEKSREVSLKHGGYGTRLYRVWSNMKNRCNNPNYYLYNHYGGKGISVCTEWNGFEGFRDWAYSNGYAEGLSIDRVDNSKGYSPDNCRWATMEQQQNNRTNNRHIIVRGENKTMAEWSKCGIPYQKIQAVIGKRQDPSEFIDQALTKMGYWGDCI